jgi:hypothetical protein
MPVTYDASPLKIHDDPVAFGGLLPAKRTGSPHNKLDARQTFNRMLSIPGGVNACRYEIMVRALADLVLTSKTGEVAIIGGDDGLSRRLRAQDPRERLEEKRVVAFAVASNNAPAGQPKG